MNVPVLAEDGARTGEVTLRDEIFGAKINVPLMHQVVTAQLAAARSGAHSTKTRGEVRGGGRKPWRQKGTGRARHGSIREPQWVGGGVAFGPKPRDHSVSVPKKMKALALRSALSARAADGKILVVDDLSFDKPKTKRALKALEAWSTEGRVLLVLGGDSLFSAYAFRNIPTVHAVTDHQLNTYDVLRADTVIFVRSALDAFQERAATMPGRRNGTQNADEAPDAADVAPDPAAPVLEEALEAAGAQVPASDDAGTPTPDEPDEEVTRE